MKPLFRLLAHLLFIGGLLVLYLLPANPYDWMQEFDPAISAAAPENPPGDNAIFAALLLIAMTSAQGALLVSSRSRLEKRVSMGLMVLAVVFWAWKFGL
jgi:hypothetical protein